MNFARIFGTALLLALCASRPAFAVSQEEVDKVVKTVDDRQHSVGDYKAQVYLEQHDKGKTDIITEGVVYRRQEDEKFILMMLKPKTEAGKGYMRADKNMFLYDPRVGKWDRRTERERLANTETRRQDLDASHLARDFGAKYEGTEKLGKLDAHKIQLKVKSGVDVAFPEIRIWADTASGNLLKQQDYAESGKLMRTIYYPSWGKTPDAKKGSEVFYPTEIRIFDEVEKGNSTTVKLTEVAISPLDANIFTKAWIESKSR